MVMGKYLIVTERHKSDYGEKFCLFWGNGRSSSGYTSDVRLAHRFKAEEIPSAVIQKGEDFVVPASALNLSDENIDAGFVNDAVIELVEKSTLGRMGYGCTKN